MMITPGMAMIMPQKIMMTMSAVAIARAAKQSVTPTHVRQTVDGSKGDGETSAKERDEASFPLPLGNQLLLAPIPFP